MFTRLVAPEFPPVTESAADAPEIDVEILKEAFREWWGANDRAMADGDTGDVLTLYASLSAAMAKAIRKK